MHIFDKIFVESNNFVLGCRFPFNKDEIFNGDHRRFYGSEFYIKYNNKDIYIILYERGINKENTFSAIQVEMKVKGIQNLYFEENLQSYKDMSPSEFFEKDVSFKRRKFYYFDPFQDNVYLDNLIEFNFLDDKIKEFLLFYNSDDIEKIIYKLNNKILKILETANIFPNKKNDTIEDISNMLKNTNIKDI